VKRIAVITLSFQGLTVAKLIKRGLGKADLYAHATVSGAGRGVKKFERVLALTEQIFGRYDGLVYIAPSGVVVRAVAGCVKRLEDPAVVVLDVRHFAVTLSADMRPGDALALRIANLTGAEPVISTTTEAAKNIIVGVGCRRGVPAGRIEAAVLAALLEAGVGLEAVRFIASADVKAREAGLIEAAAHLGVPLRIIASETIRTFAGAFEGSAFVMEKVNVPAVAEPAALLAGRRTSLLLPKRKFAGVTIAVAREGFLS
jgi:cobalt-precorrin 5A hydrolase